MLPILYFALMKMTDQPVEWSVIALMAFIIVPFLIFSNRIGSVEKQVNEMSDEEKLKVVGKTTAKVVRRSLGSD